MKFIMQNQAGHKNITMNLLNELVEQYDVEGDGKLNIKGNVGWGGMVLHLKVLLLQEYW